MDAVARKTLRLRAFFRRLKSHNPALLKDYYDYCNGKSKSPFSKASEHDWIEADKEARCITLGSKDGDRELDDILDDRLDSTRPWVLIGGPPCQAYSIAGRARNQAKADYTPEGDHRHFLYREYLRIIQERKPSVFVMENVKGILSSKVGGEKIFSRILQDLSDPNEALGIAGPGTKYRICSLVSPKSFGPGENFDLIDPRAFIIKAEQHGIPQARHRVILLGIALDENGEVPPHTMVDILSKISVGEVIGDLPKLRSRVTVPRDGDEEWYREVADKLDMLKDDALVAGKPLLSSELGIFRKKLYTATLAVGSVRVARGVDDGKTGRLELDEWYRDENIKFWLNHDARGHMPSDLGRYAYATVFAKLNNRSPKGHGEFDLPNLAPAHRNWETGKFSDRFRVQLMNEPATTITSHISKDGHYFIHYDPLQCRSLTVREAARIQTFPDNYFFEGNRTQQFHQVGNAVPPLLASKIASIVYGIVCAQTV
jgi:DNA (cytosine-5)-methyltransferase 1